MLLNQPFYIEPRRGECHLSLDGDWQLGRADQPVEALAAIDWQYSTRVPNSLYWSLYEAGALPHPYLGTNSKQYHWVDEVVWYYRRTFRCPDGWTGGAAYLCLDGAAYYARVWLNGALLGEHQGMFGGPIVDIADQLIKDSSNELVIEIKASTYGHKQGRTWSDNPEIVPWNIDRDSHTSNGDFIVMGLWRGVRIEFLPDWHLSRPYMATRSIEGGVARLRLEVELANPGVRELEVKTMDSEMRYEYTFAYRDGLRWVNSGDAFTVAVTISEKGSGRVVYDRAEPFHPYDYEQCGVLEAYRECQYIRREIELPDARLWQPNGLGDPSLYQCRVALVRDGQPLDEQAFDFGVWTLELRETPGPKFRSRWDKFQFVINGRPIFLKGMNWMPVDFLYNCREDDYRWTLNLAKDAGIQLIRIWSGGGFPENDEFYQICDELGLMVWQDSFMANSEANHWDQGVLRSQVAMNLYRIRNHPSLAVHCGGNEFEPLAHGSTAAMAVIEQEIQDLDPQRPFFRTTPDRGSAHIYRDMEPTWYRHLYKHLPFLAESGIHCFPNFKTLRQVISEAEARAPLSNIFDEAFRSTNPELLNHFTEYQPTRVPRMLARASHINDVRSLHLDELAEATQIASCEFYQIMAESMREQYPFTVGLMPWVFRRTWPTVAIQLVDGLGEPVAPYYYLKKGYEPVHAYVALEHMSYAPGEAVRLIARVIDEGTTALKGEASLRVQVLDPNLVEVYAQEFSVTLGGGQYLTSHGAQPFAIPAAYKDRYFFVRATLRQGESLISDSFHWLKCLGLLADEAFNRQYKAAPHENLNHANGPWLKPQIQAVPGAELAASLGRVSRNGDIVTISLTIENRGTVPAFPVCALVQDDRTLCTASDNFFLLGVRETKVLTLRVWVKNPALKALVLDVTAWNAETRSLSVDC